MKRLCENRKSAADLRGSEKIIQDYFDVPENLHTDSLLGTIRVNLRSSAANFSELTRVTQIYPLNRSRSPRCLVNIDHGTADADFIL